MKVVQVLALMSLIGLSLAHMRFVCPRPRSPNSGFKSGPCGGRGVEFEKEVMEVTPGPMTLHLEETVFHRGAPTRIALASADNPDDYCTLLDQVPHNEAGRVKYFQRGCGLNSWPISGCDTSYTYLTVNIPDIKCDRCFLHLISVMTDKYTPEQEPCVADGIKSTNCSTYYTCANIRIRPTSAGQSKDIKDTCQRYENNLMGTWPYMPKDGFPMGIYRDHAARYSPRGFIRGDAFVGDSATYMMGAEPTGPCAPKIMTCAGSNNIGTSGARAAVAVSVLEDRMRVTAVVAGATGDAKLRLVVNGKAFSYDVSSSGVVDMTALVSLGSGLLLDQVTATVTYAGVSSAVTCGDISFARLTTGNGLETKGLVTSDILSINGKLSLDYIAVGVSTTQANVRGPARSSATGPVKQALATSSPSTANYVFGSDVFEVQDAEQVQAFWLKWLYVDVGGFRAQVEPVDTIKCSGVKMGLCRVAQLSVDGNPTSMVHQTVPPHGVAALHYSNKGIKASVVISRFPADDNITAIVVEDGVNGTVIASLAVASDFTSPHDSTLREASAASHPLRARDRAALNLEDITIRVQTRKVPAGLVMGHMIGNTDVTPAPPRRAALGKAFLGGIMDLATG